MGGKRGGKGRKKFKNCARNKRGGGGGITEKDNNHEKSKHRQKHEEVVNYFKRINEIIKENAFQNDKAKSIFVVQVIQEINNKEWFLSVDQQCSRIFEKILFYIVDASCKMLDESRNKESEIVETASKCFYGYVNILRKLGLLCSKVVINVYSSHVMQTVINILPLMLVTERKVKQMEKQNPNDLCGKTKDDSLNSLEELFLFIVKEFKNNEEESWFVLAKNPVATHVFRSIMFASCGLYYDFHLEDAGHRNSKSRKSQQHESLPDRSIEVPQSFIEVFDDILSAFITSIQSNCLSVVLNVYLSPCVVLLLNILHQCRPYEELEKALFAILCVEELYQKTKEKNYDCYHSENAVDGLHEEIEQKNYQDLKLCYIADNLIESPVGSRVLEACISFSSLELFNKIFYYYIKNNIEAISLGNIGNFVMKNILSYKHLNSYHLQIIIQGINMKKLFESSKSALILKIGETCRRLKCCYKEFLRMVLKSFDVNQSCFYFCIIPCLITWSTPELLSRAFLRFKEEFLKIRIANSESTKSKIEKKEKKKKKEKKEKEKREESAKEHKSCVRMTNLNAACCDADCSRDIATDFLENHNNNNSNEDADENEALKLHNKLKLNTVGCLLVSCIFRFPTEHINSILDSFLSFVKLSAQSTNDNSDANADDCRKSAADLDSKHNSDNNLLVRIAMNKSGSRLFESFLCPTTPLNKNQINKFILAFKGNFAKLALDVQGGFFVTASYASADINVKKLIIDELREIEDQLKQINFVVYKKCEIYKFKKDESDWTTCQTKKAKLREMFQDVFAVEAFEKNKNEKLHNTYDEINHVLDFKENFSENNTVEDFKTPIFKSSLKQMDKIFKKKNKQKTQNDNSCEEMKRTKQVSSCFMDLAKNEEKVDEEKKALDCSLDATLFFIEGTKKLSKKQEKKRKMLEAKKVYEVEKLCESAKKRRKKE